MRLLVKSRDFILSLHEVPLAAPYRSGRNYQVSARRSTCVQVPLTGLANASAGESPFPYLLDHAHNLKFNSVVHDISLYS